MTITPELQEHVDRTVAEWPAPTPEQVHRVAELLYGRTVHIPMTPGPAEMDAHRKAEEAAREQERVRKLAEAMTACDICDVPLDRHHYAEDTALFDGHEWVAGRAEKVMARK